MHLKLELLREEVIACTRCPRLTAFREEVPFPHKFCTENGWRKPLPGFGDPNAWLLLLGLAPSIQGGNRTGRIFTGDGSGRFLMKALFQAGFANQPISESTHDGLQLKGCYLTAAVKCVPPANRPLPSEFANCSSYLENELFLLKHLKTVLALGKLAFDSYQRFLIQKEALSKPIPFAHGQTLTCPGWPTLVASYHPSPQNTNTGKLTEDMFVTLLRKTKGISMCQDHVDK